MTDDLLCTGRHALRGFSEVGNRAELARELTVAIEDPQQRYAVAAAVYAAVVDGAQKSPQPRTADGKFAAGLGGVAGITGASDILYSAARTSRDVRAVQRALETGSAKPIVRRVKNRLVGRALGRAGIWQRLWR